MHQLHVVVSEHFSVIKALEPSFYQVVVGHVDQRPADTICIEGKWPY